jgi:hypothetical protein
MVTLEVVELGTGRFGVQAIGAGVPYADSGDFDTREEAEEWIFNRVEQASLRDDMHEIIPGTGQGLR